ncbi:MAG TPA: hypothetical protein VHO28_12735 [Ignavibacteriales bacterium]|nr:hypothetical protein [Ignavibacteriales bacterium]
MNKLITILCLLCGFAGTALHAQSEDEKIKEIIELAGTMRAFDQMSGTWDAQIEQIAMDSENKTKFKNILYKVFNIDSLKTSYYRNYRKRYVKEKGDSLLVWMHSPLYAGVNYKV